MLAVLLAGCKTVADIKPDTIVDIPLHPTQVQSEPATEAATGPAETIPRPTETEPPIQAATEKPDHTSSGGKSGGKTTGKGNSGSEPAATEPPTQPPAELPTQPSTQPPAEVLTEASTEPPTEAPSYDPAGYSPDSRDRAVAEAVNARRQEAGLEPLTLDSRLCAIASVRAYELTLEWSHRRPDGSDGLTVLSQYGYGHSWAGENLFNGAGSGEKIVSRWMSADPTAGNILSEYAAVIGVGSYTTADGLTCVAAIFVG